MRTLKRVLLATTLMISAVAGASAAVEDDDRSVDRIYGYSDPEKTDLIEIADEECRIDANGFYYVYVPIMSTPHYTKEFLHPCPDV